MPKTTPAAGTIFPRRGDSQLRRFMAVLPAAAYTCDVKGQITSFNARAVELWGREPKLNSPSDRYCGSWKLFSTDGAAVAHHECWMALALLENQGYNQREIVIERPDQSRRMTLANANPIHNKAGRLIGAVNVLVDITDRKKAEDEVCRLNLELEERVRQRTEALEATAHELREALKKIKTLRGLVPVCSWCKKIRDDAGFWQRFESFLQRRTEAEFTHGICPECAKKHRGQIGARRLRV